MSDLHLHFLSGKFQTGNRKDVERFNISLDDYLEQEHVEMKSKAVT